MLLHRFFLEDSGGVMARAAFYYPWLMWLRSFQQLNSYGNSKQVHIIAKNLHGHSMSVKSQNLSSTFERLYFYFYT